MHISWLNTKKNGKLYYIAYHSFYLKLRYCMSSFNFTTQHLTLFVLGLIAGIISSWWLLPGAIILALLSVYIFYHQNHQALLLAFACCFFFFGSTRYYQYQAAYFEYNHLLEKNCNVIATVQEILPRLEEQEQICIAINIKQLQVENKTYNINKNVYLFLPYYTKVWVQPHQKIAIANVFLKHPNSTSYQEYLIKEGIWAIAHLKRLSYTTIKKPSFFMQQINEFCALPLQAYRHGLSQLAYSLYISIFCGKKIKSKTTTTIKELFSYWGISHHLARSGLHLVILLSLLLFLLGCIPCSPSKKRLISLMLLSFYYATTYPSVAFMRAFYMYLLYSLCKQLYIPTNSIHILLITTLITLVLNPCHLFFLDFQLSFSITLLILWFIQNNQNSKTIAL